MKKSTIIILATTLILFTAPSQASILSDLWRKIDNFKAPTETPVNDNFDVFYNETVSPLNTQPNIQLVSRYMESYNVLVLRVRVIEFDRDFYMMRYAGTTRHYDYYDTTLSLTEQQVKKLASYLEDGELSTFEKWHAYLILKAGQQ